MKILLTIIFLFFAIPAFSLELADTTLEQLVACRPDLVADIKAGKDQGSSFAVVTKDAKGRIAVWTETTADIDGVEVSRRVNTYTYYKTGEVNVINQKRHEAKNKLVSNIDLKHYLDGSQPSVIIVGETKKEI